MLELKTIGDRIKFAIENSGKTQTATADYCAVSKQAVTGWIKTNTIDKTNLSKLCEFTGADYDWILTGKNKPEQGIMENKGMYEVTPDNVKFLTMLDKMDDQSRHQLTIYMEGLLAGQSIRDKLNTKTPHSLPARNEPTHSLKHEEK